MLTVERLRKVLSYNADTGVIRRNLPSTSTPAGALAGYIGATGYRCIDVDGRPYKAHRLAWFYMTGVMPAEYVDHINGDKSDNRFCNLRLATNSQNQANRRAPKNNTSGVKGIRYEPDRRKWRATIWVRGSVLLLGRFDTKEAAAAAYETAAKNAFGEYAHGAMPIKAPTIAKLGIGAIQHAELTAKTLREMFSYDPDTGCFTRLKGRQGQSRTGDIAGTQEWTGQRSIKVFGKRYREHHLAWLYMYGVMPSGIIDHINGDNSDNRIANLREATPEQNMQNRCVQRRSLTDLKGVSFDPRCVRKYYARIKVGDQHVNLGHFLTAQDAADAYTEAAAKYFGKFSLSNR